MKQSKRTSAIGGLILIFLIIIGDLIAGFFGAGSPQGVNTFNCGNPATTLQCGTVTFTLSAATFNTQTITFSPAFASVPGSFSLNIPNQSPTTWPTVSISVPGSVTDYCFICPGNTGQSFIWVNMPAALTEIYGDANREHQIFGTSPLTTLTAVGTFRASVDCNTGSNSGTAVLRVQWSTDDATWNDLANTPGQGDVAIDAAVNCPGAGTIVLANFGNPVALNTNFPKSANKVYLRLVGANGGGVGDNPAFAWFRLDITTGATTLIDPCVLDQSTPLTVTGVSLRLRCFVATTLTVTFRWTAQE